MPLVPRAALVNQLAIQPTSEALFGLALVRLADQGESARYTAYALHWFRMLPERVGPTRPEPQQNA